MTLPFPSEHRIIILLIGMLKNRLLQQSRIRRQRSPRTKRTDRSVREWTHSRRPHSILEQWLRRHQFRLRDSSFMLFLLFPLPLVPGFSVRNGIVAGRWDWLW
jgi:hypothetical protein